MPQRLTCPNHACGFSFLAPAQTACEVTACPQCKTTLVIPGREAEPVGSGLPLSATEREKLFQQAHRSRWRGTVITAGVVALALGLVSWRVSVYFGRRRVCEKLLAICRAKGKEVDALVVELAPDLRRVVSCANEYLATAEGKSRLHMDNGLRGVLLRLPPAADLTPLFEVTPRATGSYPLAVRLVAARADRDWLLELSCSSSDGVRTFAAAALRPSFPLGRATEEHAARLAERMEVAEKNLLYAEVEAAILRDLEAAWAGRYRVAIKAEWQSAMGTAKSVEWESRGEPVSVSCQDGTWRVTLLDQTWTGSSGELPDVSLTCSLRDLLWLKALVPPYSTVQDSALDVTFDDHEGFLLRVHPVPIYEPPRAMSTPLDRRGTLPPDAIVMGTAIQDRGGFPTPVVQWMRPPRAGFKSFEAELVRR